MIDLDNEPVDLTTVLPMLATGPVVIAQQSQPAAVLVSAEAWERLVDELTTLRLVIEAQRIKAENDANGTWG